MAQQTQFALGAKASCSDGPCGELRRLIINPAGRTVTHLVIEPGHRHEPGRLVPVDLVDTVTGGITLRCTVAEFDRLDPAEETELLEVRGGLRTPPPPSRATGPTGSSYAMPQPTRRIVQEVVPEGETQLRQNEHVHAADGQIGRVQGLLVDPDDHRVTHVLLQEGHLWGRKQVAIPVSAVADIQDGIQLRITKQQVENLPSVDHKDLSCLPGDGSTSSASHEAPRDGPTSALVHR
jgi:sporulation protein YlmC with PRC-barrel domain